MRIEKVQKVVSLKQYQLVNKNTEHNSEKKI